MKKIIFSLVVVLVSMNNAIGANIWCKGYINSAYVDSSKSLVINGDWRRDYTAVCRVDGSGSVDTVTCSLWFSIATSSMANNMKVRLMYNDQGGTMNCKNIPTYGSSPSPSYIMLVK